MSQLISTAMMPSFCLRSVVAFQDIAAAFVKRGLPARRERRLLPGAGEELFVPGMKDVAQAVHDVRINGRYDGVPS